jgi:hypothetical protein
MDWTFGLLGGKKISVNKELLDKEINDISSLDNFSDLLSKELKKLKPFIDKLQKTALKGGNFSESDINVINGYNDVISNALVKYSKIKDSIKADSNYDNLRNNRHFRIITKYLDDLGSEEKKLGLATIHIGSASEIGNNLKRASENISAYIEILEGINNYAKKLESEVNTN